jgi:nitrogen fixation/metabolism regulation signal transduction histidine kinase
MHTGVAVIDVDNQVRMCNLAFEAMLGVSQAEGRPFEQLVDPLYLNLTALRAKAPTTIDDFEFSFKRENQDRQLLAAASFLPDESTSAPDMILVLYDITRLRTAEKAVARKERLSEMGDLAAGVAHEIRNPLNTISIAIQRLASEFSPSERTDEYQSFTEKIRGETRRLNDIITRFLELARDRKSETKAVKLDELLEEILTLLKPEAESLQIDLRWQTERCQLVADPGEITQVIHNLFSNAKEALAGKPGRVAVTLACEEEAVLLRFEDSGPGFGGHSDEQLFTPYFTTKESGTGLGLATVHRIVTGLSGEITTGASALGGGLVKITLPV